MAQHRPAASRSPRFMIDYAPMRRACRTFAAVLLLAAVAVMAQESAPPKPSDAAAAARAEELERIRAEIARLQARLEQVREQESGISGEMSKVDVELQLQSQRLAEASAARDIASAKVADSEAKVAALETKLERVREELRSSLVGLYRLGRNGYLRLFLALRPNESLLPGIRMLRFVARRDASSLETYRQTQAELEVERDQLVAQRAEVEAWVNREQERRDELARVKGRQASLLAAARDERSKLTERRGELEEREKKLAAFLDELGRGSGDFSGRPLAEFRGILDWPVKGRVALGFGPRLDPRYGTKVPHNGIDIAPAEAGDEVRAIYPGKVLFAAPFEGFGTTVVLLHAGRGLTLYGGLVNARVNKGDVVSLGTALGGAGDIVYFELRVENRPEDPARWLR